jgi:hypothetical protein
MHDVVAYLELKSQVSERTRDLAGCFTTVMKEFYLEVTAASEMLMISPPQSVALEKLIEDPDETTQVTTHDVIALSRRGSALCLHRVGGCWKAQSMNFGSFELWYDEAVPDHLYHSYCHDCWPREGPAVVAAIGRAACDGVSSKRI